MGAVIGGLSMQQQMMMTSLHSRSSSQLDELAAASPAKGASPLKRPLSAVLAYPSLKEWLSDLDNDPLRARPHSPYSRLMPLFEAHDIDDLRDLLLLDTDKLTTLNAIGPDGNTLTVSVGIANRLRAYADEDITKLEAGMDKRARTQYI